DAYKQVGLEIEAGNFKPDKNIQHTHEGSIGNLCNDEIKGYKNDVLKQFNFEKVQLAEKKLLE
ncbi:MAG: argininosuccinate lyase, partial [Paludibacter sp.]|nr:argininosuccinate lyase [Paludibacter sp.]